MLEQFKQWVQWITIGPLFKFCWKLSPNGKINFGPYYPRIGINWLLRLTADKWLKQQSSEK